MTAPRVENRDILLRLLSACNTFSGKGASSLCCVIQDCNNKLNPPVWISLRASKLLKLWTRGVQTRRGESHGFNFNPKELFIITLRAFRIRLLRTDLSHRRNIYKTNLLVAFPQTWNNLQRACLVSLEAYRPYVGAARVNKAWPFWSYGFCGAFQIVSRWLEASAGRMNTGMVKVKSTLYSVGNIMLVTNLGPSRIMSAEMKSPLVVVVWFISRRFQFKTLM